MSFTDELERAARSVWEAQLAHPFVRGIADGSLAPERFKRWLLQDYLYLEQFARVLAWATAKADRLESMRWFAAALHLTLETEMELHRRFAGGFGITADQLEAAAMWPTTRAYTDFLVRIAADGDLADLTAALLSCVWGYVAIARRLAAEPTAPRYAEWIEQYASDEFAAAAEWLRSELDRLAATCDSGKRSRLRRLFELSSRYELRFWEMCWRGESWEGGEA